MGATTAESDGVEPCHHATVLNSRRGLRRQRARTLKPGRPSNRCLPRGIARCGLNRLANAGGRETADVAKQRTALEERMRDMMLGLLFEKVRLDERRVVAVQPQAALRPCSDTRAAKGV